MGAQASHGILVGAVESIGQAEEGRQAPHDVLRAVVQCVEGRVGGLRMRLAVVAGDVGDEGLLVVGERGQVALEDQPEGMLVVSGRRHREADVVEQCGADEPLALPCAQAMQRREGVEELRGQAGHLLAVAALDGIALEQRSCGGDAGAVGVGGGFVHGAGPQQVT